MDDFIVIKTKDGKINNNDMNLMQKYLNEAKATNDKAVARELEKRFGVKIMKTEVRKIVEFTVKDPLDEMDMKQWETIDNITKFLEKSYGANVDIDWKKIKVEQK